MGRVKQNDEMLVALALVHDDTAVRPHSVHGEHDV